MSVDWERPRISEPKEEIPEVNIWKILRHNSRPRIYTSRTKVGLCANLSHGKISFDPANGMHAARYIFSSFIS